MWPDIDDVEDLETVVLDGLDATDDGAPVGTVPISVARRRRAADHVAGLLDAD